MKKELIRTKSYILVLGEAGKQLAHLPINDSPILEGVPLLPPIEDKKTSMDIGDLVKEIMCLPPYFNVESMSPQMRRSFDVGVEAYNKAREKYRFTEDDLWIVFNYGRSNMHEETFELLLKRVLQPPTHFEFEMYMLNLDEIREQGRGFLNAPTSKIKTTTNSQGQTVACGKYHFEL